jgi:hypothetical protein
MSLGMESPVPSDVTNAFRPLTSRRARRIDEEELCRARASFHPREGRDDNSDVDAWHGVGRRVA